MIRIKVGCDLNFEFSQPTPMIVLLNVHYSRASDLEQPDYVVTRPACRLKAIGIVSAIGAIASSRRPGILRF